MELNWSGDNKQDENQSFVSSKSRREYLSNLDIRDIIILSRYSYITTDNPLLTDQEYDDLLKYLDKEDPLLYQNYEDDELTETHKEHLKKLGIPFIEAEIETKDHKELRNYWGDNKSLRTIKDFNELLEVFLKPCYSSGIMSIVASYKYDGWNISAYYIPGNRRPVYAHTRGKDGGRVKDVTEMMNRLLPDLEVLSPTKVVGELCLKMPKIPELKEKYPDKNFVNARNSISSFVSKTVDISNAEDYLTFFAFSIDSLGLDVEKDTLLMFQKLEALGFETPIYVPIDDISNFFDEFKKLEDYYATGYNEQYLADGMVLSVRDTSTRDTIQYTGGNFSLGMVALKAGYWGAVQFDAEIEEIYYDVNKKSATPKARIKPITSNIGNTIRNVSLLNLNLVEQDWLCPGDIIRIHYHSEQIVKYLGKIEGAIK